MMLCIVICNEEHAVNKSKLICRKDSLRMVDKNAKPPPQKITSKPGF